MGSMRSLILLAVAAQAMPAQSVPEVRQSITRALPILQRSAQDFVAKRACVSCHHNILPILMLHSAQERGMPIDGGVLAAVEEKTFRGFDSPMAFDDAVQAATLNDPTPNDSFLLMAAHSAGRAAGLVPAVYARRLLGWQRDGHWVTSDFRPPHSSSVFTATATAIRAISLYAPAELRVDRDAGLKRARQWLLAAHPVSTEDASFRLLGLVWAGASPDELKIARKDLQALQMPIGAWSELPRYPADAYSTGEAVFALEESGLPATAAAVRRGFRFLISTQASDGTWRVHTRMISPAQISPEYFSTGFPYEKDEYLSYAGSCWAVMALLAALPQTAAGAREAAAGAIRTPPWIRVALFGTPRQLSALLDSGLDPNSQTENGTTVLMMAAPDAEKVRLLLQRGANPKTRAPSGGDAVTIAAAYRGTAGAVQELLEAGAEVQAPAGVRARHSPLLFASMTGDLDNVRLLLRRGATDSAALSSAVTFGYADVVNALMAAGASVRGTESTGINLLHWAVIADRPNMIPILVKAGVPLNATDENGYTPLMYAATIDFGHTESLKALLDAGADPSIRNDEGRTPREQARYFGHVRLAAAFR
jgi:ankyrin repeat protein